MADAGDGFTDGAGLPLSEPLAASAGESAAGAVRAAVGAELVVLSFVGDSAEAAAVEGGDSAGATLAGAASGADLALALALSAGGCGSSPSALVSSLPSFSEPFGSPLAFDSPALRLLLRVDFLSGDVFSTSIRITVGSSEVKETDFLAVLPPALPLLPVLVLRVVLRLGLRALPAGGVLAAGGVWLPSSPFGWWSSSSSAAAIGSRYYVCAQKWLTTCDSETARGGRRTDQIFYWIWPSSVGGSKATNPREDDNQGNPCERPR